MKLALVFSRMNSFIKKNMKCALLVALSGLVMACGDGSNNAGADSGDGKNDFFYLPDAPITGESGSGNAECASDVDCDELQACVVGRCIANAPDNNLDPAKTTCLINFHCTQKFGNDYQCEENKCIKKTGSGSGSGTGEGGSKSKKKKPAPKEIFLPDGGDGDGDGSDSGGGAEGNIAGYFDDFNDDMNIWNLNIPNVTVKSEGGVVTLTDTVDNVSTQQIDQKKCLNHQYLHSYAIQRLYYQDAADDPQTNQIEYTCAALGCAYNDVATDYDAYSDFMFPSAKCEGYMGDDLSINQQSIVTTFPEKSYPVELQYIKNAAGEVVDFRINVLINNIMHCARGSADEEMAEYNNPNDPYHMCDPTKAWYDTTKCGPKPEPRPEFGKINCKPEYNWTNFKNISLGNVITKKVPMGQSIGGLKYKVQPATGDWYDVDFRLVAIEPVATTAKIVPSPENQSTDPTFLKNLEEKTKFMISGLNYCDQVWDWGFQDECVIKNEYANYSPSTNPLQPTKEDDAASYNAKIKVDASKLKLQCLWSATHNTCYATCSSAIKDGETGINFCPADSSKLKKTNSP